MVNADVTGNADQRVTAPDGAGSPGGAPGDPRPPGAGGSMRWSRVRAAATSRIGRVWLATVAMKLCVAALGARTPGWIRVVDSIGTIVVAIGLGYLLFRLLASLRRRLLWRVRRKLVVSYLLIGFVPILLLGSFFVLSGTLLLLTVSSLLLQTGLDEMVENATTLATITAVDLGSADAWRDVGAVLARRLKAVDGRYPGASLAVVGTSPAGAAGASDTTAGLWAHALGPPSSPAWLGQETGGMLMTGAGDRSSIVARGAQRMRVDGELYLVVVDLPLSEQVVARIQASSGTVLIDIGGGAGGDGEAGAGSAFALAEQTVELSPPAGPMETAGGLPWVSFLDLLDWSSGEHRRGALSFQVRPSVLYGLLVSGG